MKKIVADDQIPLLDELFAEFVLIKKPGEEIRPADLRDADMLWVRTVTEVNAPLLQNTRVRFVGTATAGYDHLDIDWLNQHGIAWGCALGANAVAVAEYVWCVVAALRTRGQLQGNRLRAGVIGVGHVGSQVARYLKQMGFQVILNDPPRAEQEPGFHSQPLLEFADLDLICVHTALTRVGRFPSYHLLDDAFFQRQKPGTVVINASRGAVIDTQVLLRQSALSLCLDVWENEPNISLELLRRALIATPHIAGYSIDAKRRASLELYRQAQKFFGLPDKNIETILSPSKDALTIFNPLEYTEKMRTLLLENPAEAAPRFLELRKQYPWRASFLS